MCLLSFSRKSAQVPLSEHEIVASCAHGVTLSINLTTTEIRIWITERARHVVGLREVCRSTLTEIYWLEVRLMTPRINIYKLQKEGREHIIFFLTCRHPFSLEIRWNLGIRKLPLIDELLFLLQ